MELIPVATNKYKCDDPTCVVCVAASTGDAAAVCIESKRDGGWAVESIDHNDEGSISRALFMGAHDEKLAKEYALWKNGRPAAPYKHVDDKTEDPSLLWAEIIHLRDRMQGPDGFATWQDAAEHERIEKMRLKRQLAEQRPAALSEASRSKGTARPDLDKHAHEHHWQRPDGSIYLLDSSD